MRRISPLLIFLTVAPPLIESRLDCGVVKEQQQTVNLVVGSGALDSTPGKWPWIVPLFLKGNYICGSSLIDERHLVTTASCVPNGDVRSFFALPGRHDILDSSERYWVNRTIATAFIHPDYDESAEAFKSNADIAVLRMSEPVLFTDFIQPVCLPPLNQPSDNLPGIVVGYGHLESQQQQQTPKEVLMSSIEYSKCLLVHQLYITIVSGNSFCARGSNAAPCIGDQGSGYYVKDSRSQRYATFGIVSRALPNCNSRDFTVFVDVAKYVDWISQKTTETFELQPQVDVCSLSPCGPNARCSTFSALIKCSCLEGFFGEPPNCKPYQCQSHLECGTQQICSNQGKCINPCRMHLCGNEAICKPADGHRYWCICLQGYESDGGNGCRLREADAE